MRLCKARFWHIPALAIVAVLAQPASLHAQCSVTNTSIMTMGSVRYVYKFLGTTAFCDTGMNMNVIGCFPNMTSPTSGFTVVASANTMATMPSCSFQCYCGTAITVTITGADGLPVELLDFGIDETAALDSPSAPVTPGPEASPATPLDDPESPERPD